MSWSLSVLSLNPGSTESDPLDWSYGKVVKPEDIVENKGSTQAPWWRLKNGCFGNSTPVFNAAQTNSIN